MKPDEMNRIMWAARKGLAHLINLSMHDLSFVWGINQPRTEPPMFFDIYIPSYRTKESVLEDLSHIDVHPHPYSTDLKLYCMAHEIEPKLFEET